MVLWKSQSGVSLMAIGFDVNYFAAVPGPSRPDTRKPEHQGMHSE